ncbi:MAG: Cell surface protein precursor [Firmicutes bacterium ADurb.Bin193]|nr:MAG: Cell surface protein precursor [Firmicutes bacterium ADurb.Bin193]
MRRKLTAFILAMAVFLQAVAFAAFSDIDPKSYYAEAVDRLSDYGVLSGKGEGVFDPDAGLTRAEMAKIATVVSGKEGEAAASYGTSLYSDMDGSYWASGYITVAAKNNLILGYPDGTYIPEKRLSFAEAVTVVLRLLGYSNQVLGDNWPEAYTAKAAELSLTQGMSYGDYDGITRADMAVILDRALLTDVAQTNTKLIEKMKYTITNECIVLATNSENKNLLSDEVSTTIGSYKVLNDIVKSYVTKKVKLVLNRDQKAVNVIPISQKGKEIIVQSVVGNEMAYTENGVASSMKIGDNSIVYYQGAKRTFADVSSKVETGMTMAVYFSDDGGYDYAVIKDFEMLGPFVITADFKGNETSVGGYPFTDPASLRVIRDGYESSLTQIKAYDVVYYNSVSNILYSYCDKVSGVYEKALPNKAGVSKIVLSGVEYDIETQNAVKLLGEYPGSYKINDYMTLLLGRDGRVVSAVNMTSADLTSYGIILSSFERKNEDTGIMENYLKAFTISGIVQEFRTDRDYRSYRGRVIEYKFTDGILIPRILTAQKISGKIDFDANRIGRYWFAKDAKIVDLLYSPAIDESGEAVAKIINLSDITIPSLNEAHVVHAETDSVFGDIQFIVLNNVTHGAYKYGIVTGRSAEAKDMRTSSTYKLLIDGTEKSYSQSKVFSPKEGDAVMVNIQNNSLVSLLPLAEVVTNGAFSAIDAQRVKIGKESYKLASDVQIYLYKDFKYTKISLDDIDSFKIQFARPFIDRPLTNGGLVRVLIVQE